MGKVKVTVTGMKKKNVATPTPETVNKATPYSNTYSDTVCNSTG
ncbi:MAG: hypothetical protein ACLTJ5_04890 [Clostridium sp.]